MQQTVVRIGNSIGAIIPQVLNSDTLVKPGDKIRVNRKGNTFLLSPVKKERKLAHGVNGKFMKMADEFIEEHKDVLQELANR